MIERTRRLLAGRHGQEGQLVMLARILAEEHDLGPLLAQRPTVGHLEAEHLGVVVEHVVQFTHVQNGVGEGQRHALLRWMVEQRAVTLAASRLVVSLRLHNGMSAGGYHGYLPVAAAPARTQSGGSQPRSCSQSSRIFSNRLSLSLLRSAKLQRPSSTRSRTAWPEAGERPKPTLDMVATTRLAGSSRRSSTGRPSGVFSITPAQLRISRRCAAPGISSATRRARLRVSGLVGRAAGPSAVISIHSCGPPPKARLPRRVWRP